MGNVLGYIIPAMNGFMTRDPDRHNPTLADIQAHYLAEQAQKQAEQSAKEARELAEQIRQQSDQDREQARVHQEEANQAAARAARQVEWMMARMEETMNAANRAQDLSEAAANAAREEATKLAREAQEEHKRFQGMREELERMIAAIRAEAGRGQQAADEQRHEVEAGGELKEEIHHIMTPLPGELVATKRRTTREDAEKTMVAEEAERGSKKIQSVVNSIPEQLAAATSRTMQEDAEKAMATIREKAERAQQAADEQRRRAEASRAQAEEAARAAVVEAQKAKEAKEDAERRLKEGIRPVVTPTPEQLAATKKRIQYKEGCFHFAIAGISGSGKSSLVNAFRGLRATDAGAAHVGVIETTLQMTRYPDVNPESPLVWYNVPGAGTIKCHDWQYFNDQGLYAFDCIIVLLDNRFTMADIAILVNARRFNIPTYIVRSKSDQHIRNVMREMEYDREGEDEEEDEGVECRSKLYDAARKQFIEETRMSVKTNLEDANLPDQRAYIISNVSMLYTVQHKTSKMAIDEAELLNDLLNQAYSRRGTRREE